MPICLQNFYGGAVASWLVRSTPDRAVRVQALAWDIVLCSWARRFTLAVSLYTQVYKWVPTNLILGVTLRWTSIPSRGGGGGGKRVEVLVASCYRNLSNLLTNGPLDSCADLLNALQVLSCSNLVIDTWCEKTFLCFLSLPRVIYIMQSSDQPTAVRFLLNLANKVGYTTSLTMQT